MPSTLNADNGAVSGSAGLKSTADSSGVLALQTNGTTALSIDTSQNITTVNKFAKASMPVGSVLQAVQGTTTLQTSTSSLSFVTTNFSVSITPSSTTSKILAIVSLADCLIDTASRNGCITLYRGSTNLSPAGTGVANAMAVLRSESGGIQTNLNFSYLDSPSTTSSTTYTVYFAVLQGSGTFNINNIGTASTMVLMEIAG
jgi:hypothetical protein